MSPEAVNVIAAVIYHPWTVINVKAKSVLRSHQSRPAPHEMTYDDSILPHMAI